MKKSITSTLNLNFLKKVEITEPVEHEFDLVAFPLLMINESGRILIGNRAAEARFSVSRKFLEGKHIDILFPDRLKEVINDIVMRFLEKPNAQDIKDGWQLICLDRNGKELFAHVYIEAIANTEGVILFTIKPIELK